MQARLLLEDGSQLTGKSFGVEGTVSGEFVFNTGMTGYQEILTDPSYAGQIVVMTYPLIGNYGINPEDVQSEKVNVSGLIVKEWDETPSHWKSHQNLSTYLKENQVMAVGGLDTRSIARKIRIHGVMNGVISTQLDWPAMQVILDRYQFPKNIVSKISTTGTHVFNRNLGSKVALIDMGVKKNMIDCLKVLGIEIHLFPWNVSAQTLLKSEYKAVILSNGPGDPKDVETTISTARALIGKIPMIGICLGHQVLALALGADTYKLKFGHRGSNHPVIDLRTNKVAITSQNHGYAVRRDTLPSRLHMTHLNVNDETIEGFEVPELNVSAVQFHPEAGPGPQDSKPIFSEWLKVFHV